MRRTGEIGAFAITSESGIAAGVRRIEALTGKAATEQARRDAELVKRAAALVRTVPEELMERLEALSNDVASLRKELERERVKSAGDSIESLLAGARSIEGVRALSARTKAEDIKSLRGQADRLRDSLGTGAGVLGAVVDGNPMILAVVTDDLAKSGRLRAGDIVREVAEVMGGRGGGKPHLAQAGGGDASLLDDALAAFYSIVENMLGS